MVQVNDHVKISLQSNPTKFSDGKIFKILSDVDLTKIRVLLTNGDTGTVVNVINSEEIIKKRIMTETQYTENKDRFNIDVMRNKVIPKTVQSFLNSDGGYLYIGVKDTGNLKERLVGLSYDFDHINSDSHTLSNEKLCDKLEIMIMDTLEKYLISDMQLGSLIKINFINILNIQIIEIAIKKSSQPWFFRNISKNKEIKFELCINEKTIGQRYMDDFYIRRGGSKKLLETHKEFYDYAKNRFINIKF